MAAEGLKKPVKKETMTTELIHVALVGDKGVGKSLLARARACGTKYTLKEMFQLHISQVWTYDNYRTSPEVRERSLCHVDGVNCTLKIFDTFGNRDVKRENVYSLADAIVICFSVSDKRSLQSVTKHWINEIRFSCPAVPIILCACKIDLRYIYKDPKFLELQKFSFSHQMQKENLIYPESGKEVAKEIKAYYYETSSMVSYGVDDLFNNAIRAVLVAKRRSSFAFRSFKNVSIPHVQVPHAPPKPTTPKIVCEKNENSNWLEKGRKKWLFDGEFSDATLIVGNQTFEIHRVFLAAASPLFENIFLSE
ncbi:hypothetical protein HELRODRAFT_101596, partial [Helobdella robusta]|uniref:BTB domain-containing protein n=1 Tax=Helobdella robusta TaxID=6412 RepID=T1ED56_HELRO